MSIYDLEEEFDAPEDFLGVAMTRYVFVEIFGKHTDIFGGSPRCTDYPTASVAQRVIFRRSKGNVRALFAIAGVNRPLPFF